MIDSELAFNLILRNDADVTAIVSTRIYNGKAPQGAALPLVAHNLENDGDEIVVLDGLAGLNTDQRMRVFCSALTKAAAKRLSRTVRLALAAAAPGVISNDESPADTIQVQGIFKSFGIAAYDETTKIWSVITDYLVTTEQEVPD
jgi:hypothetical protein